MRFALLSVVILLASVFVVDPQVDAMMRVIENDDRPVQIDPADLERFRREESMMNAVLQDDMHRVQNLLNAYVDDYGSIEESQVAKLLCLSVGSKAINTLGYLLAEYPAMVNEKDFYGETALVRACSLERDESWGHRLRNFIRGGISPEQQIVKKLLEVPNIDVNSRNRHDGGTVLMQAALNGHTDTVILLLQANVDIMVKNNRGQTALDIAKEHKHNDVIQLIQSYVRNLKTKAAAKQMVS